MHSVLYEIVTGVGIGIIMALPTGPIGFLVIRRMMVYGLRSGIWSAAGSIIGDLFYVILALVGVVWIENFITKIQDPLRFVVGIYILYIGIIALRKAKREVAVSDPEFSPKNDFLSTFLLAIGSPHNFAPFVIAFSIVGVGSKISGTGNITLFTVMFLMGSILWWVMCGLGIEKMRAKGHTGSSVWVRKLTAWILIVSGIGFMGIGLYQFIF